MLSGHVRNDYEKIYLCEKRETSEIEKRFWKRIMARVEAYGYE